MRATHSMRIQSLLISPYKDELHNIMQMEAAMQARFPHFVDLFHYINTNIVALNTKFTWNGWNAREVRDYILNISIAERHHIRQYVDLDQFMRHVRSCVEV